MKPSSALKRSPHAAAHALDGLEVDLVGDERVGRGRLGPHHVLGRAPAHVGERHDLVAGRAERRHRDRGGGRPRPGPVARREPLAPPLPASATGEGCTVAPADRRASAAAQRVIPRDPAAGAGAGDLRLVDVVLREDASHHRREHRRAGTGAVAVRSDQRRRLCSRCRGGAGAAAAAGGRRCRLCRRSVAVAVAEPVARPPRRERVPVPRPPPRRARRSIRLHPEPSPITANFTPTSTVSPSGTRISREHAGRRRGHLGVDLVRRHLEERLVARDLVADRLHPLGDGALGHGLAELWHHDVSQGAVPFRSGPTWSRRTSRRGTGAAG